MGMIDVNGLLEAGGGLILAREHRQLRSSLSRWVKQGRLKRLMRGVYGHPQCGFAGRLAAVRARIPGGVIAGDAAMAVFSPNYVPPDVIEVFTPTHRMPQAGYRFVQRRVPPEYVHRDVVMPVMAAVDRADVSADWIDDLVRTRQATPQHFNDAFALCPGRVGNPARRRRVARTSTRPFSAAERDYHDLFDKAKITGWEANLPVQIDDLDYEIDVALQDVQLAIEIDGYRYHSGKAAFENDRRRQDELTRAGWTVLRFTWAMLSEPDWVIGIIQSTRKRLRRKIR